MKTLDIPTIESFATETHLFLWTLSADWYLHIDVNYLRENTVASLSGGTFLSVFCDHMIIFPSCWHRFSQYNKPKPWDITTTWSNDIALLRREEDDSWKVHQNSDVNLALLCRKKVYFVQLLGSKTTTPIYTNLEQISTKHSTWTWSSLHPLVCFILKIWWRL